MALIELTYTPATGAPLRCYSCGTLDRILIIRDDYAVCDVCEERHQQAMDAEYPYGQCQTCGVAYFERICHLGKSHIIASHAEGACGQWVDYGDTSEDEYPGYCYMGCRPPLQPWEIATAILDSDELPF